MPDSPANPCRWSRWSGPELDEELGLDVTAPFRRLHLIHVLYPRAVRPAVPRRRAMAATEQDAEDYARITWTPIGQATGLHLYPAVGAAIETLAGTRGQPAPVLLPPITDQSFRWR